MLGAYGGKSRRQPATTDLPAQPRVTHAARESLLEDLYWGGLEGKNPAFIVTERLDLVPRHRPGLPGNARAVLLVRQDADILERMRKREYDEAHVDDRAI